MTDKPEARLDFRSPEEFAETCRALAMRLHHLNRVAIGEHRFASEVADQVEALGRTFARHFKDDDVRAQFGDGWTAGTIPRDDQPQALFNLTRRKP